MAEEGDDDKREPPYSSIRYWMRGLGESTTPFLAETPGRPTLETFAKVSRMVVDAYGGRCAMTGAPFDVRDGPPSQVEVVAIRPAPDGGTLHPGNFILLSDMAAHAFFLGHVAVWSDFRLVADLSTIDPELLETLNPDGRLILPNTNPPDADALRWHRENVFATRVQSG